MWLSDRARWRGKICRAGQAGFAEPDHATIAAREKVTSSYCVFPARPDLIRREEEAVRARAGPSGTRIPTPHRKLLMGFASAQPILPEPSSSSTPSATH